MSVHYYEHHICRVCGREYECSCICATLPSLEAPEPGTCCPDCGRLVSIVGYCASCDDPRTHEED
jgi:hypothetical protein